MAIVVTGVAGVQISGALTSASDLAATADQQSEVLKAFPALVRVAPEPVASGIPASPSDMVTAKGVASSTMQLALTESGKLCVEVAGTATCQSGIPALRNGVFVAELDCAAVQPRATISGVAPANTRAIDLLLHGSIVGHAAPDSDGAYEAELPGATMDTIRVGVSESSFTLRCPVSDKVQTPAGLEAAPPG